MINCKAPVDFGGCLVLANFLFTWVSLILGGRKEKESGVRVDLGWKQPENGRSPEETGKQYFSFLNCTKMCTWVQCDCSLKQASQRFEPLMF